MLWDFSRIIHAVAKFSQPDGCMISLVTDALLEASPCEFITSSFSGSNCLEIVEICSVTIW